MEFGVFENLFTNPYFAIAMTLWSLPWKGYALWKAARKAEKYWFVALLLLNTAGMVEILYIFVFSKRGEKKTVSKTSESNK